MKKKLSVILLSLTVLASSVCLPQSVCAASVPKPTSIVSVTSPKKKQVKVKWKKKSGVSGYQIQCATSKKFAKKSTISFKVKKASTTAKTIKKLKSGKKYYIRVRTYKDTSDKTKYSKWSKVVSVKVKKAQTTTSTYSETTVSYSFRYDSYLDEHFEKHKDDTNTSTKEEYLKRANDVINNKDSLHKKEKEDGDDIYYLEKTNELVVVSTDGYIRTYFCPDSGLAYYESK